MSSFYEERSAECPRATSSSWTVAPFSAVASCAAVEGSTADMEESASTLADAPAMTKRGKRSGRGKKNKTSIVETNADIYGSQDKQAQDDLQCQASKNRKKFEVRKDHHATVDQRLEHLEKVFADSADKHTQWEKMHVEQARLQKQQEEQQVHHASLQERMYYIEKMLGDSADKHELREDIEVPITTLRLSKWITW